MADSPLSNIQPPPPSPLSQSFSLEDIEGNVMKQAQAKYAAQQAEMAQMDQQAQKYGAPGMSNTERASLLFQAAGALAAPTRGGGLMESIGAAGTAVAGPLQRAAQAERERQDKMAQLQLARAKLAGEMGTGGLSPADMVNLYKLKQGDVKSAETFKASLIGPGKYALVGDQGTVKPIPGDISGASGASSDLVGEDYLKTLPRNIAQDVKAMAEGRISVPILGSKNAERAAPQLDALKQYLGDDTQAYDNIIHGRRKFLTMDMTSNKPNTTGYNLRGAATMLDHLGTMAEKADKLENYDTPTLNRARWALIEAKGGPEAAKLNDFKQAYLTYSGEAAKAVKGGVPGVAETLERHKLLNETAGPDVIQSHIETSKELLLGRMRPIMDNYNKTMGTQYTDLRDFIKDFAPQSLHAYDSLENKTIKGSARYKEQQAQRANAAETPTGATSAREHPQAQAALEYARKHPEDPRSADILKRFGAQ